MADTCAPTTFFGMVFKNELEYAMGTWLVGFAVTIFVQGILFMQAIEYYKLCRYDRLSTKIIVALVAIMTWAKCGLNFWNMWRLAVSTYGNYDEGGRLTWAVATNLVNGHVITFVCQTFYLKRLWRITRSSWWGIPLVGITAIASVVALVLTVVMTVPLADIAVRFHGDFTRGNQYLLSLVPSTYMASTALLILADSLITGTMIWFLLSSKKDMVEMSDDSYSLVRRLIRVTIESAAPPLVIAILNLSLYYTVKYAIAIAVAFGLIIPSMYAVCLMHTIIHRCRNRNLEHRTRVVPFAEYASQQGDCHCNSKYSSTPPRFANITTKGQVTTTSTTLTRETRTDSGQDDLTNSTAYTIPIRFHEDFDDRKSLDHSRSTSGGKWRKRLDPEAQAYNIAFAPVHPTTGDQAHPSTNKVSSWTLGTDNGSPSLAAAEEKDNALRSSIDEPKELETPAATSEIVFQPPDRDEKYVEGYV